MANSSHPKTAILYQNPAKTVTLIDVPTSIYLAQGISESPNPRTLLSSPPLQAPYASTEPKSKAARAKIQEMAGNTDCTFSSDLLLKALEEINNVYLGMWCLPRKTLMPVSGKTGRKRKRGHMGTSYTQNPTQEPDLKAQVDVGQRLDPQSPLELSTSPPYSVATALDVKSISHQLVQNINTTEIPLHISMISQRCVIPPCSSFMLSSIGELSFPSFSHAAYEIHPNPSPSVGPGQFDFVLLDPPWENRSVRRAQKYTTLRQETNPMDVLHNMFGKHIAQGALVGCWVTNNLNVRDTALGTFRKWGVQLVEQWAWLKTTIHGDPVSQIDGLWRKPYEILLLGRKQDPSAYKCREIAEVGSGMHERVIVAVPDIHSRKPNLKELITPMMPNPLEYRALEIFARNLTAGWWSWGDEVLKFNWEGHWSKEN